MQEAGAGFVKNLKVDRLGQKPLTFSFKANVDQRAEVAERLGIVGVNLLDVYGDIHRKAGQKFLELTAEVKAIAVQSCVVSLAPVEQEIDVTFSLCYTFDKEDTFLDEAEYVVDMEEDDLPELIEDGQVDVVSAVCEQIALSLDPYPRAVEADNSDGAKYLQQSGEKSEAEGEEQEVYKPFANLKDLLNKE